MTYEGVKVQLHVFLTSATDGDEQSASLSNCLPPGKGFRYPYNKRLDGHSRSSRSDKLEDFCRESKPGRPARS
jgi:hypothetical protein